MKDETKKIIIIAVITVALFITIFYAFRGNNSYIILDNKIINFDNGKFTEQDFNKVKKMYFSIFYNEKYIGKYYAESIVDDNVYFTNNKSENSYNFKSPYIAITSDFKYISYELEDATESDFDIFKEYYDTTITYEEIDEFKKTYVDIDNDDNKEEIFYIIYNDMENYDSFSVTYVMDDSKYYLIDECLYQNNEFGTSRVYYILRNSNNNKTYLVTNTYYMDDNTYNIYLYSNNITKLY